MRFRGKEVETDEDVAALADFLGGYSADHPLPVPSGAYLDLVEHPTLRRFVEDGVVVEMYELVR